MKTPDMIVLRPIVSERSYAQSQGHKYAFAVATDATKVDIRRAIEERYEVSVTDVNTLRVQGKAKLLRTRNRAISGRTRDWKKAIVTLKAGDKIENLFPGV